MKLKLLDRRRFGNNKQGNPNIYKEAEQWRFFNPNWKEYLTRISRERSTGAKTYWGKLKVSMNARKYFGSAGRFSNDSLFIKSIRDGYALSLAQLYGDERMIGIIEELMTKYK